MFCGTHMFCHPKAISNLGSFNKNTGFPVSSLLVSIEKDLCCFLFVLQFNLQQPNLMAKPGTSAQVVALMLVQSVGCFGHLTQIYYSNWFLLLWDLSCLLPHWENHNTKNVGWYYSRMFLDVLHICANYGSTTCTINQT